METVPIRITKHDKMSSLKNTELQRVYDEIDASFKNILISLANTDIENYGLNIINQALIKLTNKMRKSQNKRT